MTFTSGGTTYYFGGTVSNGKGSSTTDKSKAAKLYIEAVSGGYYIYMKDSSGNKSYLAIGDKSTTLSAGSTAFLFTKTSQGYYVSPSSNRTFAFYASASDVRTYLTTQNGLVAAKFVEAT